MTSKEKAEELVSKMLQHQKLVETDEEELLRYCEAKQSALIAVEEVIEALYRYSFDSPLYRYWQEVKQEINKL